MKTPTLLLAAALAAATLMPAAADAAQGRLVVYTSTPNKAMADLIAAFNKAEPEVTVEFFRSGTTEVLAKLDAEFAAGSPEPDLLLIADSVAMAGLKARDRLAAWPDAPVEGLPATSYDQDRTWFGTKIIATGIAWNTAAGLPAPTGWADLAAPAAKDRVVMPSPLYSGAATIHVGTVTATQGLGWSYMEALKANGATALQGNGAVLDAVATGRAAYGVLVDFMAFNAAAKGSPVGFVYPAEGATAVTEPVAILKTARNVDAARAFVAWLLSETGQRFAVAQGYMPLRPEAGAPPGRPATVRLLEIAPDALAATGEETRRRFAALFGG
ncbi:ABC transporter substrate-binding protein [Tistrella mobilis]|uniref:ABC transporter substrate-binding protein n=1 Tax=Tistrella mobilis TaxID=171437 RepID=UPI0031F673A6